MRQRVLRQIAVVLVLVLAAATLLAGQSADTVVYVTKTGAKYHRAGCTSLRSSSIATTLGQASIKFEACKNCKPPILAATAAPATPAANAPAKAAPAERAVQSGRCQATTKKGAQCSRNAKAGSRYCWQHG